MVEIDANKQSALPDAAFWKDKRVLVTGHTGFKGGWLVTWLRMMGAEVSGISLAPCGERTLFDLIDVGAICANHLICDINDADQLKAHVREIEPQVVFHLAAVAVVSEAFDDPLECLKTNVIGTANLLEALRGLKSVDSAVIVTTDKVYSGEPPASGFTEDDRLGSAEPYSASKAAAEMVVDAFRACYFADGSDDRPAISTARSGNVIGGGDWATNRLIPDCVRALEAGERIHIRNPGHTRPWQHVLEPLLGYILLGEKGAGDRDDFEGGWNFGPSPTEVYRVTEVVENFYALWGNKGVEDNRDAPAQRFHESENLVINSGKAARQLGWTPTLDLHDSLRLTCDWYKAAGNGESPASLRSLCEQQIRQYLDTN